MIVRKAVKMAALMKVPVIGVVQNLTHLICPECGARVELFGTHDESDAPRSAGLPVLASIPVDPVLSALCDSGEIESYADNPFDGMVDSIAASLDGTGARA
jgi:hypothetical protein